MILRTVIHNIQIRQQSGGTLIFGLVMLLALTILGLASIDSSNLELKMSGNALESSRVFHAAERARVAAEKVVADAAEAIDAGTEQFICNSAAGYFADFTLVSDTVQAAKMYNCSAATNLIPDLRSYNWNNSTSVASLDAGDTSEGRYIIEYLGMRDIAPNREVASRDADTPVTAYFFRISVRGSFSNGAETYLRSFFMR